MGLIYKMPTTVEETSNIIILDDGKILIKSYPPSKTLWNYFYLVIASVLIMSFVTKSLILTLLTSVNYFDQVLGSLTVLAFICIPATALGLLCYQKRIVKDNIQIGSIYNLSKKLLKVNTHFNEPSIDL